MAELKRALEQAGFGDVKTVLSSGNAVFSARPTTDQALARKVEAAVEKHLGVRFFTLTRAVEHLQELIESEPYAALVVPRGAKRVVTFLSELAQPKPKLPIEQDGARILSVRGGEVLSAYVPSPKGPVFMTLLERTFGKNITTRTWDTVAKLAK